MSSTNAQNPGLLPLTQASERLEVLAEIYQEIQTSKNANYDFSPPLPNALTQKLSQKAPDCNFDFVVSMGLDARSTLSSVESSVGGEMAFSKIPNAKTPAAKFFMSYEAALAKAPLIFLQQQHFYNAEIKVNPNYPDRYLMTADYEGVKVTFNFDHQSGDVRFVEAVKKIAAFISMQKLPGTSALTLESIVFEDSIENKFYVNVANNSQEKTTFGFDSDSFTLDSFKFCESFNPKMRADVLAWLKKSGAPVGDQVSYYLDDFLIDVERQGQMFVVCTHPDAAMTTIFLESNTNCFIGNIREPAEPLAATPTETKATPRVATASAKSSPKTEWSFEVLMAAELDGASASDFLVGFEAWFKAQTPQGPLEQYTHLAEKAASYRESSSFVLTAFAQAIATSAHQDIIMASIKGLGRMHEVPNAFILLDKLSRTHSDSKIRQAAHAQFDTLRLTESKSLDLLNFQILNQGMGLAKATSLLNHLMQTFEAINNGLGLGDTKEKESQSIFKFYKSLMEGNPAWLNDQTKNEWQSLLKSHYDKIVSRYPGWDEFDPIQDAIIGLILDTAE